MEKTLHTPLTEEAIRALNMGDTVYVSGGMFTARDEAHLLLLEQAEQGKEIPFPISELALFHCGPVVKKVDEEWRFVSAGPTTSIRMEIVEDRFLETFSTRLIIGKGGMGSKTLAALQKVGAVYAHYTGGAGALAARAVKKVAAVHWLDKLGVPEAVWVLEIERFGPLTITMDSHGKSLYSELDETVKRNMEQIHAQIDKGAYQWRKKD